MIPSDRSKEAHLYMTTIRHHVSVFGAFVIALQMTVPTLQALLYCAYLFFQFIYLFFFIWSFLSAFLPYLKTCPSVLFLDIVLSSLLYKVAYYDFFLPPACYVSYRMLAI